MKRVRCYLIRHAQTTWNGENRIQGHSDIPLSPLGQHQAKLLSRRFAHQRLAGVFASTLQRSRHTAEILVSGNGHRIRPVIEPDLVEMHLGEWEGLTPEEVNSQFQNGYQQWKVCPSAVRIPGAEPLEAFRRRVHRIREKLMRAMTDGEYAIVSHGGVIAAWISDLLGADYDLLIRRLQLDNTGVTALEFHSEIPQVLWINSTTHLIEPTSDPMPSMLTAFDGASGARAAGSSA
jgi:alpha-ribazole phosphatase